MSRSKSMGDDEEFKERMRKSKKKANEEAIAAVKQQISEAMELIRETMEKQSQILRDWNKKPSRRKSRRVPLGKVKKSEFDSNPHLLFDGDESQSTAKTPKRDRHASTTQSRRPQTPVHTNVGTLQKILVLEVLFLHLNWMMNA
eukprot:UN27863